MFVGESGVQRVVKRACELMKQDAGGDPRALGGIDLPTIQKYLNLWYSLSLDLFGGEVSSNAADAFAAGLKGRYKEDRYDEHKLVGSQFAMDVLENGKVVHKDIAMRNALNEVLRTEYIKDCQRGVDRWNKTIKDEGITHELELPSNRFHRQIGMWAGQSFSPDGAMIDAAAEPEVTLHMTADDYVAMMRGELNGQMAFLTGKLKFDGNLPLLMQVGALSA